MLRASEAYLAELADEFLAGQTAISWEAFAASDLKGETTWIDASASQPGVEVAMNYRRLDHGIEIEVIAYEPDDQGQPIQSERRVGVIRKPR